MFKLKPGNVFQKINKMDKKQAYTLGAIGVILFILLITFASFLGKADNGNFDDYSAKGYDLAQMPFATDEAEQFLLNSNYSDMKGNGISALYTKEDKEARQEEDEKNAEEVASSSDEAIDNEPTSHAYSGRGGYMASARGAGTPTQIGSLGSASLGHASGNGVNATWGAKGDFSPYKSQDKGKEIVSQTLKTENAKKGLFQAAKGSRAAAGLKDGKAGNSKKAMMGGNITGSDAFNGNGVDLSKAQGMELDTNAPVTTADLGNLEDAVEKANDEAKEENEAEEQSLADKLKEQFFTGLVQMGLNGLTNLMNNGIERLSAKWAAGSETTEFMNGIKNLEYNTASASQKTQVAQALGGEDSAAYKEWMNGGSVKSAVHTATPDTSLRKTINANAGSITLDNNGLTLGDKRAGAMGRTYSSSNQNVINNNSTPSPKNSAPVTKTPPNANSQATEEECEGCVWM